MNEADRIRVRHMIAASRDAIEFAGNRDCAEIAKDRMVFRSLERQIEIVGEAASKISTDLRNATPQIPWSDIIS
ncbi:MAG: DUF86 domain-containing protein, partial [Acidobacteria bacterium]|nr:DUF86 domain-containing protein [Acidobacteriota bacterium]